MHVGTSKVSVVVRRERRKTKHSHWFKRSHMGRPPDKRWHLLPGSRQGEGNSRIPNSIRPRIPSPLDWSGKPSHLLPSSNVSKNQIAERVVEEENSLCMDTGDQRGVPAVEEGAQRPKQVVLTRPGFRVRPSSGFTQSKRKLW